MHDDFDLIVHRLSPTAKAVRLFFVADLHKGAPEFDEPAWYAFKKKVLRDPDAYIILGGDLMNNGLKTSKTNCYAETCSPSKQKHWLIQELRPFVAQGKVLAIIPGNHEYRNVKEVDQCPAYDIAVALGITDLYRQNIACLKLIVGRAATVYSGAVRHHGGTVYQNESFSGIIENIDFFVTAHTHRGLASKPDKIVFDLYNNKVTSRTTTVLTSVPWLRYGGYAIQKGYKPSTSSSQQCLELSGTSTKQTTLIW